MSIPPQAPNMIEAEQLSSLPFRPVLTPRQDRFEERLVRAISSSGPRSAMRDAANQLVDHLRLQGIPASHGLAIVMEVASRGSRSQNGVIAEDQREDMSPLGPSDCLALVARWATARYE